MYYSKDMILKVTALLQVGISGDSTKNIKILEVDTLREKNLNIFKYGIAFGDCTY